MSNTDNLRRMVVDYIKLTANVLNIDENEIYKFLNDYAFLYGALALLASSIRFNATPDELESLINHLIMRIIAVSNFINERANVLDIGCGFGYLGKIIVVEKKGTYVGLDNDPKKIEIANALGKTFGLGEKYKIIQVSEETPIELPFKENSFDVVTFIWSIHDIKREIQEEYLKEIARMLKNNRKLLIYDREIIVRDDQLRSLINKYGFKLLRTHSFGTVIHKAKVNAILAIYKKSK